MKINILRATLIILLFLQMWIIFGFSNQDGEKSGTISRQITELITKKISAIQNLPNDEKEIVLKKIEHIVRKLAHFSIYTVIGFLLMSLMSTYKIKQKNRIAISAIIGLLYAISDEIHQAFVPGRGPQIGDVGIDFAGVIIGVLIMFMIMHFYLGKKWEVRGRIDLNIFTKSDKCYIIWLAFWKVILEKGGSKMFNINGYGLVLMLLLKIEELQQELQKYKDNESRN